MLEHALTWVKMAMMIPLEYAQALQVHAPSVLLELMPETVLQAILALSPQAILIHLLLMDTV
jgi:hypothetical protein